MSPFSIHKFDAIRKHIDRFAANYIMSKFNGLFRKVQQR